MDIDITDFLPKYPNIFPYKDNMLNSYEGDDFYNALYHKKEFYDHRLDKIESFPEKPVNLMNHQTLIARYFSSYTIYDKLLLVHEMGTGKTCSAVGSIEQIRKEGKFKKAVYIAKGEALINNFINELIFKCTDGRYIPKNYEKLTSREKVYRKKKAIKDFYTTNTFEMFAKSIEKLSDELIKQKYNNSIIIIDEVHNLRIQKKKGGLNIYNAFWRFLHTVEDCKILLMSGTPMKDGVGEISSVMNLILDENKQLPGEEEFLDKFFNKSGPELYSVKPEKIKELKAIFKGKVSYLSSMKAETKKVFEGEHYGELNHLYVKQDMMSQFQSKNYIEAYNLDRTERKGVYSKSRQASLFVYPDGSYGDKGFIKYMRLAGSGKTALGKKSRKQKYVLSNELRKELSADTHEEMIEKLKKFSSKYAASIENILKAQRQGKLVFIYNEFVKGSGLLLFTAILELFGFTEATGSEPENSQKPRYASLTSESATSTQLAKLVNRFNKPDNLHGEIIGVILGSRKVAEGFTLMNVQIEEIHTPWFNYSETSQVIARGYRLGSHKELIKQGISPTVVIYQRVSIPKKGKSIDLEMYEISESKDISIKGVERIMKESAWDCALNYHRNYITGFDHERECDYTVCDYRCDGVDHNIIINGIPKQDIDVSSYNVYYSMENIDEIKKEIHKLFKINFSYDLNTLLFYIKYPLFEIISALYEIINNSEGIINKYGFTSYLKEENDVYYLIDSLSVSGEILSDYYTEFPTIKSNLTFSQILEPYYNKSLLKVIDKLCNGKNDEEFTQYIKLLSKETKEIFIEAAILAEKKNIKKNKNLRSFILKYFDNYIANVNDVWLSWFNENDPRCLEDDKWTDCKNEYIGIIDEIKKSGQKKMETNPYGYYGQYNKETSDFCIRDVSGVISEKKHQRTSGRRCKNWNKSNLIPVIIDKLKVPIPLNMPVKGKMKWEKFNKMDRQNIIREIKKNKYVKNMYNDNMSNDELKRILFWSKQGLEPTCMYLKDWFEKEGLLVEDPGCGNKGRTKI